MLKLICNNARNYFVLCLAFVCVLSLLIGQNMPNLGIDNKDKFLRLPEVFVIEAEVDPSTYILGPGDKIGVSIITSSNMAYILTITPTGELWIPDVGPIYIAGITNSLKDGFLKAHQLIKTGKTKSYFRNLVK